MRIVTRFNDGFTFRAGFDPAHAGAPMEGEAVTLPHNAVELPFSYFDETSYQKPFTYQKRFAADPTWDGKEVALVFDGAMANSVVYLNGEEVLRHKDGYTPFELRLTGRLKAGDNLMTVVIDGSENPGIPPFGATIDYLTYAGIYRDVWLKVTAPVAIANAKLEAGDTLAPVKRLTIAATIANPQGLALAGTLTARLKDGGREIAAASATVSGVTVNIALEGLEGIALWDIDDPRLYDVELTLETAAGDDAITIPFGFRTAEFTPEGFRLNGRPLKLRGLNRHQSFPYAGYGLGRSAQERDAEIVKHQLKCNIVRTSHYPQSPFFLDHCDRIGLLVFEEIPGWQHIGDAAWKAEAVENVRRMIRRDWNHPSIIIWGVRINESQDDHDFYVETNRAARELDATRPTGGVRYITESELLEDVYTMNDFVLGNEELGGNRPRTALRPRRETTGLDRPVPYLITEYNGHMYPTKSFDQEQRQAEHVRRHLEVLDAAYGDPDISGAIGWCAFDYNTHKDFGSGDRLCHHGVMDMFREPKFAAYAYASQTDPSDEIILEPVTFWARGERNIGGVLPLVVLTNCDEVELFYGDHAGKRVGPDREAYPNLPHPPVVLDRRHFTDEELGLWGMKWEAGRIVGYVGGKAVKEVRFAADPVATRLEIAPDTTVLRAGEKDCVRVIVRALDQEGHKLPFLMEPVEITVTGPGRLVGPELVPLRGGSTGFWIETSGGAGEITAKVTSPRFAPVAITLSVKEGD